MVVDKFEPPNKGADLKLVKSGVRLSVKTDGKGWILKPKSRWFQKGFQQTYSHDYEQTYSPSATADEKTAVMATCAPVEM